MKVTGEECEPLCFHGMDEQKVTRTQLVAHQVWQTYRKTVQMLHLLSSTAIQEATE